MTPTPPPNPACPRCNDEGKVSVACGLCGKRRSPATPAAAGGGTERPDTAALLTIGDWLLRTLPGHLGAEQTAAALAYTARWIDAQPPVPPSPAPRVDRADLIERLYDANGFDDIKYHEAEVRGLLTEAADALDARTPSGPCPYIVTGDEGTSHCSLAESRPAPVERPQPDGDRMATPLSRFAWLADSARSEGFQEAAAAYTVCRDELSDALTPAPSSSPVGDRGLEELRAAIAALDAAPPMVENYNDPVGASEAWNRAIDEAEHAVVIAARALLAAPSPAPLDVRLYGTPDDERLDCDPDEAVQSYLDVFCGEFPVTITLEEHDTYPPRAHFPSGDYAAEWCAEWSADNDTDEGFGDQAMDAAKDPAVVAAFDAAIDLLASKITYRMADKVTASYEVTITDESTWTYDPEFVSLLAAADRGGRE